MKKIIRNLIFVAIFVLFPSRVLASGNITASPSSLTIEVGSSKTFTITATNTIGDVSISSSNSGVARVNTGEWGTGMVEEGQTKSGTITVTGVSVGSATITLTLDAATFDGDDLAGQTRTVTVNVVAKPTPTPTPTPNPPSNNNSNNNNNNSNNDNTNNKSKNNNIKELSIEGYELVKTDNNNYTLVVPNNVTSVNVKATAEDSKAKVDGAGSKELKIGENVIEVIITSESGAQNKISIKVTRKDAYYLDDLESLLSDSKLKDVDVVISKNSELTEEKINKIKDSKKTLRLTYYDDNKKMIYSWTLNGSEIKNIKGFTTEIDFTTENQDEISELSNYADGVPVNFKHSGDLPSGTKIKLYVGNKFNDGSIVNVYHYNEKKLDEIVSNLKVVDGYIEFEINHCSEYFVTQSNLSLLSSKPSEKSTFNIFIIISLIELIIIIIGIIYIIKIKSFNNSNKINIKTIDSKDVNNEIGNEEINTINVDADKNNNKFEEEQLYNSEKTDAIQANNEIDVISLDSAERKEMYISDSNESDAIETSNDSGNEEIQSLNVNNIENDTDKEKTYIDNNDNFKNYM